MAAMAIVTRQRFFIELVLIARALGLGIAGDEMTVAPPSGVFI
jgi:hypothetical protein